MNQNVLNSEIILELAITMQNCCLDDIDNDENLLLNEIYIANIALIIKDTYIMICKNENWNHFMSNHKHLMESQGCGKNKKMHFKLLDISEKIGN